MLIEPYLWSWALNLNVRKDDIKEKGALLTFLIVEDVSLLFQFRDRARVERRCRSSSGESFVFCETSTWSLMTDCTIS